MSINNPKKGIEMKDIRAEDRLKPLDSKSLWMENDLSIFFGPAGIGKSTFAVQLAIDVTHKKKEPVMYIDCELSEAEFMQRFSSAYLGPLFWRTAPNVNELASLNAKKVTYAIKNFYNKLKIKYFIIDNMSIILDDATNYDKAKHFILEFKSLVDDNPDLSIMLIGHTPKRDNAFPVTPDSLAGSKALLNFIKSAFAIMPSVQGKNIVYVEQVKARNNEIIFDDKNVLVYKREKKNNILLFTDIGTGKESDHLFTQKNIIDSTERNKLIFKLNGEGKTLKEISDACTQKGMPISREGVRQILNSKKQKPK